MKTQLKIQMLGSSFSIQTDQSREHIEDVLACLNQKIGEVLEKYAGVEPVKIALLAALNLADDVVRLRGGGSSSARLPAPLDEIGTITDLLIKRIDRALAEGKSREKEDA